MMVECCTARKAAERHDYWANMGFSVQNTARTGVIMIDPQEMFYVLVEVCLSARTMTVISQLSDVFHHSDTFYKAYIFIQTQK